MISEFYLKKALNIRKEYLSIVSNINLFENMAKDILRSYRDWETDRKSVV